MSQVRGGNERKGNTGFPQLALDGGVSEERKKTRATPPDAKALRGEKLRKVGFLRSRKEKKRLENRGERGKGSKIRLVTKGKRQRIRDEERARLSGGAKTPPPEAPARKDRKGGRCQGFERHKIRPDRQLLAAGVEPKGTTTLEQRLEEGARGWETGGDGPKTEEKLRIDLHHQERDRTKA